MQAAGACATLDSVNTQEEHGTGGDTQVLASEREARAARLSEGARRGQLTLGEYAERVAVLARARSAEDLDAAVAGIAETPAEAPPLRSWLAGVLGGSEERGRWRLGRRLTILALFGGVKLDLRQAQIETPEPRIGIFAFFGGVEIAAPPGVPIALSGLSLLGGKSDERPAGAPLPGAPPVRVRAWAVLAGVKIK